MTSWPTPYPDVCDDLRKPARRAKDAAAAEAQSTNLLPAAAQITAGSDVLQRLVARRPTSADVLPIEPVEVDGFPAMFVVADQVLVRQPGSTDDTWKAAARARLADLGYRPDDRAVAAVAGLPASVDLLRSAAPTTAVNRRRAIADGVRDGVLGAQESVGLVGVTVLQSSGLTARVLVRTSGSGGDVVVKSPGSPFPTEIDLPARLQNLPAPGPVAVAIIDTGITAGRRTADDLLNEVSRASDRLDALDAFGNPAPPYANGRLDFAAGHGTFAAGIVRQVDPLADIRVYRAVDSDGFGSEARIAAAMVRAVRDGAQVINLSLGTHTEPDEPLEAIESVLAWIAGMDEAVRPVVVAAAGNSGSRRRVWPAASDGVQAVAALTPDGPAEWSSRGDWVSFSTIGRGIVSTFVEGVEDPELIEPGSEPDTYGPDSWGVWTGTSFAAPQIAGALSRAVRGDADSPARTPTDAVTWLKGLGTDDHDGFGAKLQLLPGT